MSASWTQPICEADWIAQRATWGPVDPADPHGGQWPVAVPVPVVLTAQDRGVERCAWCGHPTIWGAFVRVDPASVPFPADRA